jgi:putative transposase
MVGIVPFLQCLQLYGTATTRKPFSRIAVAMVVMTKRVTMLGVSCRTGKEGSYFTVQRWFSTTLPWATLLWVFFQRHLHRAEPVYLLAGDEVVVTNSGIDTYGVDRFSASLYGKPGSGLAFFAFSLVDVHERRAFPMRIAQVIRPETKHAAGKVKAAPKTQKSVTAMRARGRP